jgi:hypothetical protein
MNNVELHVNAQNILAAIHESWPKNTSRAYESKLKEFKISKLASRQEERLIQLTLVILQAKAISR